MSTEPTRMCVGCRKKLPKDKLDRFVVTNSELQADKTKKIQARGYYVCSPQCELKLGQIVKKSNRRAKK